MAEDYARKLVRCAITGHVFDFNEDLGAVYMRAGSAACTPCLDKMFSTTDDLRKGPRTDARYKTQMVHRKPKRAHRIL